MSWIVPDLDNKFVGFVYSVTEPIILPVRMIIERIPSFSQLPVDISFTVTFILLMVIQYILPVSFAF